MGSNKENNEYQCTKPQTETNNEAKWLRATIFAIAKLGER